MKILIEWLQCETSSVPQLCATSRSFLYQAPPSPKKSKLECLAIQTDTYGRTEQTSAIVDISVEEPGFLAAAAWTSGQIAGLVIGLVFLFFILLFLLLLLCYCCGWCCCAGKLRYQIFVDLKSHFSLLPRKSHNFLISIPSKNIKYNNSLL